MRREHETDARGIFAIPLRKSLRTLPAGRQAVKNKKHNRKVRQEHATDAKKNIKTIKNFKTNSLDL